MLKTGKNRKKKSYRGFVLLCYPRLFETWRIECPKPQKNPNQRDCKFDKNNVTFVKKTICVSRFLVFRILQGCGNLSVDGILKRRRLLIK